MRRMLSLVVVHGPDRGRTFPLPSGEPQLVGRSTEALDLVDPSISRRHAELTPDGGKWLLRDLGSRHGTFVNGVRISGPVSVTAGDRIRCGDTEFLVADASRSPARAVDAGGASARRIRESGAHAHRHDETAVALELLTRAAEPVDGDTFLGECARVLGMRLGCSCVALRALDQSLEEFVAPPHALGARPEAPLALVRQSIIDGEILAAGDGALSLIVPFGSKGGTRGVFVLQRTDMSVPSEREVAAASRPPEIASLALAARGHREAHSSQERLALIGETVASLSHSIKNILQGLRFGADAVDLALSRGELAKAQEGWPVLQRNLDRIHALVLNMLAWTKARPLEPEPCDLNGLLREVRDLLAPAAGRRRVGVVTDLDPALPEVPIDAPAVHQAVTNLVLNAIEAAPERIGLVTIASRLDSSTNHAVVSVRDNGSGIPEGIRPRLFEPFVSSKGQRGTGLGLAVARKIAERHGGSIAIVASAETGTEIAIHLPASREHDDPGETRAPRGIDPSEFDWRFE
jgi:two-component system, NtrC family, sensor kinase